jgi:hypothetical protein
MLNEMNIVMKEALSQLGYISRPAGNGILYFPCGQRRIHMLYSLQEHFRLLP